MLSIFRQCWLGFSIFWNANIDNYFLSIIGHELINQNAYPRWKHHKCLQRRKTTFHSNQFITVKYSIWLWCKISALHPSLTSQSSLVSVCPLLGPSSSSVASWHLQFVETRPERVCPFTLGHRLSLSFYSSQAGTMLCNKYSKKLTQWNTTLTT